MSTPGNALEPLTPEPDDSAGVFDPPQTPVRRRQPPRPAKSASAKTPQRRAPEPRHADGTFTPPGARQAVRARWATEQASDDDLTALFSTIAIDDGMALLARMRQTCELAARTLERRRTEETLDTQCKICETTKRDLGNRQWRMTTSFREPRTQSWETIYLCSDMCVIQWNKRKGMDGIPDRGVAGTRESVEARAQSSIMAHQEKMRQDKELVAAAMGQGNGKPARGK